MARSSSSKPSRPSKGNARQGAARASGRSRSSGSSRSSSRSTPRGGSSSRGPRSSKGSATRKTRSTRPSGTGGSPLKRARTWLGRQALFWGSALAVGGLVGTWFVYQDSLRTVRAHLAAPADARVTTVWSAPAMPRPGEYYPAHQMADDLLNAGLERTDAEPGPGQFRHSGNRIDLYTEAQSGPDFEIKSRQATITFRDDRVTTISPTSGVTLPPTRFATFGDVDGRRSEVQLSSVSAHVEPALLAIEDTRFHHHMGVDPLGIARAVFHNLTSGGGLHGGSTLTQQLAKNLFLSPERTIRRKVREAFHALALEHVLSKQELLNMYLTEVYLGHQGGLPIHGFEQGARAWFGKSARNLTLAEAATMAGIISSPNTYHPLRHPDRAKTRRDLVLRRMVDLKKISEAEAQAASAEPLNTLPSAPNLSWRAPWVVAVAMDEVAEHLGNEAMQSGGLDVYTTVQPHHQWAARTAVRNAVGALRSGHSSASEAQAALVALDAWSGHIVAIVGGYDYRTSPFHRAVSAWRQAGSTVKPLTMMALFDEDSTFHPATLILDEALERSDDDGVWAPTNYDGNYKGVMTVQRAIEQSRNLPAIRMAEKLGAQDQQHFFEDAGLSRATALPSAALGAFPATPLELARAYGAFAADGVVHEPTILTSVTADRGESRLYTYKPSVQRIATVRSAELARHVLEGVVTRGTAASAAALGAEGAIGGKTGTTDEGRDAWFVGISPQWSISVWVGNDTGTMGLSGAKAALPVWAGFANMVRAGSGSFKDDTDLRAIDVCASTGLPPCKDCEETQRIWLPTDDLPEKHCNLFGMTPRKDKETDEASDTDADAGGLKGLWKRRKARRQRRAAERTAELGENATTP